MNKEAVYWIALAHLNKWEHSKINALIHEFYTENKISIEDFFNLSEKEWKLKYPIDEKDIQDLQKAKATMANHAFMAENLFSKGYELIPITLPEYPVGLKHTLDKSGAPPLLYIKGNKELLKEKLIAINEQNNIDLKALKFKNKITNKALKFKKVIVSGLDEEITDKQLAEPFIKQKGRKIIVLPQGISTFTKGFKLYYKPIVKGDMLVLSIFQPMTPWSERRVKVCKPIVYSLAEEVYSMDN